jgi:hypothetical protein
LQEAYLVRKETVEFALLEIGLQKWALTKEGLSLLGGLGLILQEVRVRFEEIQLH